MCIANTVHTASEATELWVFKCNNSIWVQIREATMNSVEIIREKRINSYSTREEFTLLTSITSLSLSLAPFFPIH
jgi:ribosomal protein L18